MTLIKHIKYNKFNINIIRDTVICLSFLPIGKKLRHIVANGMCRWFHILYIIKIVDFYNN